MGRWGGQKRSGRNQVAPARVCVCVCVRWGGSSLPTWRMPAMGRHHYHPLVIHPKHKVTHSDVQLSVIKAIHATGCWGPLLEYCEEGERLTHVVSTPARALPRRPDPDHPGDHATAGPLPGRPSVWPSTQTQGFVEQPVGLGSCQQNGPGKRSSNTKSMLQYKSPSFFLSIRPPIARAIAPTSPTF